MSAVLSPCGLYRLRLDRTIPFPIGRLVFAFFGVNPSKADAEINDQTVMKWFGFTERNDGCRFIVGNPFAYRATDVRELASVRDPIGPENDYWLRGIIRDADILVPCWGSRGKLPPQLRSRLDDVMRMLVESGKPIKTFGLTVSGDPKHPLMLGYNTPLVEWKGAA